MNLRDSADLLELLSRTALRDEAAYEALYRATAAKQVSAQAAALLQRGAALAVSVEPPGGSPTGQPTGPVTYQGKLI